MEERTDAADAVGVADDAHGGRLAPLVSRFRRPRQLLTAGAACLIGVSLQDNMATDGAPTAQKPAAKGKMYDMTSADYYFDSYAHFGASRSAEPVARSSDTRSPQRAQLMCSSELPGDVQAFTR